ncbi:MAG: Wzz/FepE/Etk N-terminal domain-containing protein [Eubacteriales bacterium]|nr:Wzz/FepE/Etk N-terminal domain-containing protein [Eubacteriales bacterium]
MNYNAVQKDNGKIMLDLRPLILALIRRAWKIALVTIACALIAFAGAKASITPMYRSSFQVYASIDGKTDEKTLQPMVELATSDAVLQNADSRIDSTYSIDQLKGMVSASLDEDENGLMTVSVTMANPEDAATIAQTIRDNMQVQISFTISSGAMELLDEPTEPTKPYSPDYNRYGLIGAAIGFLVTVLYILIKELFDRRVNKISELEKQFGLPILGTIPNLKAE